MSNKFYNLTNDILFKATFANQERSELLICLINALLRLEGKEEIVKIELLNPFNDRDFIDDKSSIVDIKVRDAQNIVYCILY
ncbi:MAG: hypothetical protein COB02_16720 [Candidatus Cloacimonadota bacterium]|nr:MAG: hypothetical protein COB02_16720 [Candidatus Cloacimonadota bacterium]